MSFRGVDRTLQQYLRGLQDQINELKKGVGQTRQNTIRLGNWVIDAEDDKRLKMTNVLTKEVTYVGDQSVEFVGSKEWSYSGVVAPTVDFVAPEWSCPYDVTVDRVIYSLQAVSSTPYTINTRLGGSLIDTFVLEAGKNYVVRRVSWDMKVGSKLFPAMLANGSGTGEELSVGYWYTGRTPGDFE